MSAVRKLQILLLIFLTTVGPVLSAPTLSNEQLQQAYERVQEIVGKMGIQVSRSIPLEIRPQREVEAAYTLKPGSYPGADRGGYYQQFNPERIWIANDQPMWLVYHYLSTSLAEAWVLDNVPRNAEISLAAAFCAWVSYKTYKECGLNQYATTYENMPASANMRRILKYERENGGVPAVVAYMKKETKLP